MSTCGRAGRSGGLTKNWLRADRYAPGDLSDLVFHPAGANSKRKLDVSKFLAAKPGDGQLRLQLDPEMVAEAERRGLHRWIPKKMEEPFAMSNCRTRLTDVDAHKRRLLEEGIPIDSPKGAKAKPWMHCRARASEKPPSLRRVMLPNWTQKRRGLRKSV